MTGRNSARKGTRRSYRFELFEDIEGGFRVRLVSARNENTLWSTTEAYFSRSNARRAYVSLIRALDDHSFEDLTRAKTPRVQGRRKDSSQRVHKRKTLRRALRRGKRS